MDTNEINKLHQRDINEQLGRLPSQTEVTKAIKGMSSEKAPGKSGVTTDMLKNLPPDGFNLLTTLIQNYWQDINCDFDSWHTNILSLLYKGKGDSRDPKNWRPICLKETTAKIISTIVAKRLLDHINDIGARTQFGHIGCQEALHSLRNLLITRRHHGKETYVLFVDLIKAFDSIDQNVMFKILEKYGIPQTLLDVIKKMYNDVRLQFTIGKEKRHINYTNGVFQGDNASPILFLFVMMAATDSFTSTFQLDDKPTFNYFPDKANARRQNGRLKGQCPKAKGVTFEIENLLYVDDGVFICNTRSDLERLTQELHRHFLKFGLKMHVGYGTENSKTVAMYFPPTLEMTTQHIQHNRLPPNITINDGKNYVHFVNHFKYLGAYISDTLKEDFEIQTRISKAWSVLGAMKHFFKGKDVDLRAKALLYVGGPLNALLWGAESWNLSKTNLNKLNAFHHTAMRWILGINMERVKNERIKNVNIRRTFCNLPTVDYYIKRRVWNYIRKIVRTEQDHLPKKLLGAWIQCPRKLGQPQKSCRNLAISALRTILPEISENGKFSDFFELAKNKSTWTNILKEHEEVTLLSRNHTDENEPFETDLSYISFDDINTNINTPTGP